jgi:PAS domain S-box-containing protein
LNEGHQGKLSLEVTRHKLAEVELRKLTEIPPFVYLSDGAHTGSDQNISEHKIIEGALNNSEAELRVLFAAMTDVILVLDAEGRYLKIAPTSPAYRYKPPADLIGKKLHEVFPLAEADFFLEHIRRGLDEGCLHKVEYRLPIGGRDIWFEGTVSPMTHDAVLWIARDITERKILEEQLRQAQKLEVIGQLAGGIAHDFSNLLIAITIHNELALKELGADNPLRRNLEEIKMASDRATALTHQILAFSRKQVVQPKVLNLNTVVIEMKKMLQRLIGENIELHTAPMPDLGDIEADPGQLTQIIMNLAINARDAMPFGGQLTIETQNIYLDEANARQQGASNPGAYVLLAVSDTGMGMDEQTQKRIFEPFFTTKETDKGTGLGLATVYGIVKQSGGHIWVSSEVGRGTTFQVYLPRVDEGVQEDEQSTEPEATWQGTETILLAEDEQIVRKLTREILEMHGYQVLEAANGGAAISICERHQRPIHLLLSDVIMPELGGRELASRLAQKHPELKVLYMSGYMDAASLPNSSLETNLSFLQKPFTPDALARKVREVLDTAKNSD